MTKPFNIPKHLVMQAYELVKANAGAGGVDQQSLGDFEKNLKDSLYKIWNRLSSGCSTTRESCGNSKEDRRRTHMEKHPNLFVHWRNGMKGSLV